jgi:hypothetical protein
MDGDAPDDRGAHRERQEQQGADGCAGDEESPVELDVTPRGLDLDRLRQAQQPAPAPRPPPLHALRGKGQRCARAPALHVDRLFAIGKDRLPACAGENGRQALQDAHLRVARLVDFDRELTLQLDVAVG